MSSLPQPSTASTAAWYSRLVNRKLLRCLSILVLVHITEVSAFGLILSSTKAIRYLGISLGILVTPSLLFLLLGMYSSDPLVYRSLYHVGHILIITCGYMGFSRAPPDDTPVSTMSWPMSTLFAVCFAACLFVLACVMNGVYDIATETTGRIPQPLLTLFQMHVSDAEETHETCNCETGNHSIRRSVSAFSHQAQRRASFNEETRALLCPSPVEGKSEENLAELV